MKQKAQIVFETEESVIIKSRRAFMAECKECGALAEMITAEIAAALTGFSERELFRLIEKNAVHFTESERVFICRHSLEIFGEKSEIPNTRNVRF